MRVSERQEWYEHAVLGTMLASDDVRNSRLDDLDAQDFQGIYERAIFTGMAELREHGEPCDLTLLKGHIERAGDLSGKPVGEVLIGLVDEVERGFGWMVRNADQYADELRKEGSARRLVDVAKALKKLHADEFMDAGTKLAEVAKLTAALERDSVSSRRESLLISGACREFFDQLDGLVENGVQMPGLRTGFADLDNLLGPLEAGSVVVLAAQTSVGKSAFGFNIAANAIKREVPTLFCACEMPRTALVKRWVAMEADVSSAMLRDPHLIGLKYPKITEAIEHLNGLPLHVDDDSRQTVNTIRSHAARVPNLGLIVVDYLQIMQPDGKPESRHVDLAQRMDGLRAIAKDFKVPLVVMSQLNRDIDKREGKRPQVSDLRDSGSIEENANIVLMLYRREYHERRTNPHKFKGITVEPCEVIVAKNREGECGNVLLGFEGSRTRFVNLTHDVKEAYWREVNGGK